MPSVRNWCQAMQRSAEGRATLSNILHDCQESRLPSKTLKEFFGDIALAWNRRRRTQLPETIQRSVQLSKPNDYCCKGPDISGDSVECSRVMSLADLIEKNIDVAKIPFAITGHLTNNQVELLEKFGFSGAATNTMRTARPFAWVTLGNKFSVIYAGTKTANVARKLLGMTHFQKDEHLVEIRYPKGVFRSGGLFAPTFLDGCPSLVYRSTVSSDGWGRAVDLDTLANALPEAVHEEINFTDDFKLRNLGRLKPLARPFDWSALLGTFKYPWKASLYKVLVPYV